MLTIILSTTTNTSVSFLMCHHTRHGAFDIVNPRVIQDAHHLENRDHSMESAHEWFLFTSCKA